MPNSTNQPSSAEDIFAPTDPAGTRTPSVRPTRRPAAPYHDSPLPPVRSGGSRNRTIYLTIIVIVVVLVVGSIAGLAWWKNRSQTSANASNRNTNQLVNQNANSSIVNVSNQNANATIIPNVNESTNAPADSDRDGLSDTEEASLGTNPQLSDTDGDGLSDLREVRIYHSDPLVSDSDGNGVSDGDEVSAGDNPTGSGSLFDISNKTINSN
ncbi:MAG: hypothetical protein WC734_05670 [Patescibacteria group bacterium]|jgi:hypothetical protein